MYKPIANRTIQNHVTLDKSKYIPGQSLTQ